MSNELAQDASLLQEYLTECDELLQRLDQDLVALEDNPQDIPLLNRIFRALHTIKGTSGFMGFSPIVELSHHAEDVLNLLRKGERKVTRRTMDVLLAVLDQLRRMIGDVRRNTPQEYNLGGLLKQLRRLQAPDEVRPTPDEIATAQKTAEQAELSGSPSQAGQATPAKKIDELLLEKQLASAAQMGGASGKQGAAAEGREARTVRVDVGKLDVLVNLVGELVLERNRLIQLGRQFAHAELSPDKFEAALSQSTARLTFITEELQSVSLKTRMVPIAMVFRRFPRLVRDTARSLGKELELVISGEETELDKTVVEEISDPLIHLVRNAVDHGIELPQIRVARGKPRKGVVRVRACQQGDQILITISDDGAGIDLALVASKAQEKGWLTPERARLMTAHELLDLVFLPGLSTAERVSDISGRGVGMDVVRSNIKRLNGTVELDSRPGEGTTVTLRLPLTLAILPALLVRVSGEIYALPLRSVLETVRVRSSETHLLDGTETLRLRDRVVPLLRLRRLFGLRDGHDDRSPTICVVIVSVGERQIGLVVDQLLGQEEAVIKPLGSFVGQLAGVAGATISGDGRVRLILDPAGVAAMFEAVAT